MPLNLSDTAATSQDGSSLEFIAANAVRQCYIQDASGRGLCCPVLPKPESLERGERRVLPVGEEPHHVLGQILLGILFSY